MLLTIDIGNSRIKAAWWQGDDMLDTDALDYRRDGDLVAQMQAFCHGRAFSSHAPERVLAACVAGEAVEQALQSAMAPLKVHFFRTSSHCCGIHHGYAEPAQHGVDRWAALIGARKLAAGNLCIIDIGTAVTVDLLAADNRHLGGRIMPGLAMMKRSLQQSTAAVKQTAGEPVMFATSTADAVGSGVLHMLAAAVAAAINDARRRFQDDNMRTFLTGGQAGMLMQALQQSETLRTLAGGNIELQTALVMHGLQVAAEQN